MDKIIATLELVLAKITADKRFSKPPMSLLQLSTGIWPIFQQQIVLILKCLRGSLQLLISPLVLDAIQFWTHVWHVGDLIMLWGCSAASGPGGLERVQGRNQEIIRCFVQPSVQKLGLHWMLWVFQQDNDPKHEKTPRNGSRRDAGMFRSGQPRVQIWITSKTYGEIWKHQLMGAPLKHWRIRVVCCWKVGYTIACYKTWLSAVTLAKGCATKY